MQGHTINHIKSKVRLSRFSIIVTTFLNCALYISCFFTLREKPIFFILLSIALLLLISGLLYGPISIKADSECITIGSIMRKQRLMIRNVESVELFQPTMGAIRIFGSGGYMGYWGIFRESDIGRYVAYYGKASDCFLVRMKNGDKYVLGCENPRPMVNYISSQIK